MDNSEIIKEAVRLLSEISKELGENPVKIVKEKARELGIKVPEYITYIATKDLGIIKQGEKITFDRDDKTLLDGKIYIFTLNFDDEKLTTYGIYNSSDNSFIINNQGDGLEIDEYMEIIGRFKEGIRNFKI